MQFYFSQKTIRRVYEIRDHHAIRLRARHILSTRGTQRRVGSLFVSTLLKLKIKELSERTRVLTRSVRGQSPIYLKTSKQTKFILSRVHLTLNSPTSRILIPMSRCTIYQRVKDSYINVTVNSRG